MTFMKKNVQTKNFKKWHRNKSIKSSRKKIKRKNKKYDPHKQVLTLKNKRFINKKNQFKKPIIAPKRVSILSDIKDIGVTVSFLSKIRNNKHVSIIDNSYYVSIDLSEITYIDFSTICVLKAAIQELLNKNIHTRGNFPKDKICKKIIEESGMLNLMTDMHGKEYKISESSELLFIQTGKRKLTREDNMRISTTIKKAIKHLTGIENHCSRLRNILLEICGNSIEWGGTINKGWLLGVKYNNDEVIFTITDVGNGILHTLNRKFRHQFLEFFQNSNDVDILYNAFTRKYGSSSEEVNRNKGLPSIKKGADDGLLLNLKVITNNVSLHFNNPKNSFQLNRNEDFQGTLYRWSISVESLQTLN